LVALIGGALVADLGYHALRSAPRIEHDEVSGLDGGVRVMIQMDHAKDMMLETLKGKAPNFPPSLMDRVLPYEVTLRTAPETAENAVGVTLYINERRLGPAIAKAVPEGIGKARKTGIEWAKGPMQSPKRGELLLNGAVPLDKHTLDTMAARWGETQLGSPLPMEKTHFIEMRCDNRDGALYAFVSSLVALRIAEAGGKPNLGQIMARQGLDKYMRDISDVHVAGDLTPEGGMTLTLTVECSQDCQENTPKDVYTMVDTGYAQIAALAARSNVQVEGETVLEGFTVRGNYATNDIRALAPLISGAIP